MRGILNLRTYSPPSPCSTPFQFSSMGLTTTRPLGLTIYGCGKTSDHQCGSLPPFGDWSVSISRDLTLSYTFFLRSLICFRAERSLAEQLLKYCLSSLIAYPGCSLSLLKCHFGPIPELSNESAQWCSLLL